MLEQPLLRFITQKSNTVERFHRSMKRKLTALIHEFDDEWDEALPATLLAMRTSVNRTTGFHPILFGAQSRSCDCRLI